jgi:hypothetical protein
VNSAKKRIINLNWRLLSFGGLQEVPINFTASQMSVETVYDYSKGYTKKLDNYLRLDLSLSFVKNKPKSTRTFAIDIQNVTGIENDAYHHYDFTNDMILLKKQLGIIPILIYRIDF